jgi:hypothetical protein
MKKTKGKTKNIPVKKNVETIEPIKIKEAPKNDNGIAFQIKLLEENTYSFTIALENSLQKLQSVDGQKYVDSFKLPIFRDDMVGKVKRINEENVKNRHMLSTILKRLTDLTS